MAAFKLRKEGEELPHVTKFAKGAYIYDVRVGWGEGVSKKQTRRTLLREFCK